MTTETVASGESAGLLELDGPDRVHLGRMLRREWIFRVSMVSHLVVAVGLGVYFSWAGTWDGTRAVILLLLLLSARAHLRGLRSARLLRKLATQLELRSSLEGGGDL